MITGVEKCIQETGIKGGGDVCIKEKTNKRRCDKVYHEIVNTMENGGEELVFFLQKARKNEQLMKLKGGDYKFTSDFF